MATTLDKPAGSGRVTEPQLTTVPSLLSTTFSKKWDAEMATTLHKPEAGLVWVTRLSAQPIRVPSLLRARLQAPILWSPPAETAMTLDKPVGMFSTPYRLVPQPTTVPSALRAR